MPCRGCLFKALFRHKDYLLTVLHRINGVYIVRLELAHAPGHHLLPLYFIHCHIAIQIFIPQRTAIILNHPPLFRWLPCKSSHPCPMVLNSWFHHTHPHCVTWLWKHAIHFQGLHPVTPYLRSFSILQLPGLVEHRVVAKQRAESWPLMFQNDFTYGVPCGVPVCPTTASTFGISQHSGKQAQLSSLTAQFPGQTCLSTANGDKHSREVSKTFEGSKHSSGVQQLPILF